MRLPVGTFACAPAHAYEPYALSWIAPRLTRARFCPVSGFITKDKIKDPQAVELWLKVNGEERQRGSTGQMIHSIPRLIA